MPTRSLWTGRVVRMMLCALLALYLSVFAFIRLSDGRMAAVAVAATVAIITLSAFQGSLPRETGIAGSLQANAALWILFVIAFVVDAVAIHPGLAKDVEPTAAGIGEYTLRLLGLVALPGAVAGVGVHGCLRTERRLWLRT